MASERTGQAGHASRAERVKRRGHFQGRVGSAGGRACGESGRTRAPRCSGVRGLAVAALLALMPAAAQAQSTALWTATLTVGTTTESDGDTIYGYLQLPLIDDVGSLSPRTFTRGTATVAVSSLAYNSGPGGMLVFRIVRTAGTTPSDGLLGSGPLTLTLGSETFAIPSPNRDQPRLLPARPRIPCPSPSTPAISTGTTARPSPSRSPPPTPPR